ncbi:MAG: circularly permuted type 2 ATP-grasp protein [Magnetococcales bacterium]|nr:circularly permuted type 2 ATP-grasp protein [Magnetococcales bacterium]
MNAYALPNTETTFYKATGVFDELVMQDRNKHGHQQSLMPFIENLGIEELHRRQSAAEVAIRNLGITFTVYSEGENIDRAWPFDIIPRCIDAREWARLEQGLIQRAQALNAFIDDLYNDRKIIKDNRFPEEVLAESVNYLAPLAGVRPKYGIWAHLCGSDLLRDRDGTMYVLEDNLRVPSGVSYMLENRMLTKRVFPELFRDHSIRPVDDYPCQLYELLASLTPRPDDKASVVVLTPGIYNSAYFEHAYLAQQMGVPLVESRDLTVGDDDRVYMKTIHGLDLVDVIYRRIDDQFIDPQVFRSDSALGIPGIINSWRKGEVALANAPGTGVADDKVVYSYMPEIIRYYLAEDPIIPNVPTWRCHIPQERQHVLANLDKLVVKPANESGGYGMLMGLHATSAERTTFAARIQANPRNYIGQQTLTPSTAPTLVENRLEPRHMDLRPFILSGRKSYVTPGGLTRVALRRGSYVVNSSQGGGSKDTWVLEERRA